MNFFGTSYAFDHTFDAAGAPTGVANVEQSFFQGAVNTITGAFNGGKSASVGASHTVGTVVVGLGVHMVADAVEDQFGIKLNPFKKD